MRASSDKSLDKVKSLAKNIFKGAIYLEVLAFIGCYAFYRKTKDKHNKCDETMNLFNARIKNGLSMVGLFASFIGGYFLLNQNF